MNHKQFEELILREEVLAPAEKASLKEHLSECSDCQDLQDGWEKSLHMIRSSQMQAPAAGFADRFEEKLMQERRIRRIVRIRLIAFASAMLIFTGFTICLFSSNTVSSILANLITLSAETLLFMTRGISQFSSIVESIPSVIRWSAGLFLVGAANMFVLTGAGIIWKARSNQKKLEGVKVHVEK